MLLMLSCPSRHYADLCRTILLISTYNARMSNEPTYRKKRRLFFILSIYSYPDFFVKPLRPAIAETSVVLDLGIFADTKTLTEDLGDGVTPNRKEKIADMAEWLLDHLSSGRDTHHFTQRISCAVYSPIITSPSPCACRNCVSLNGTRPAMISANSCGNTGSLSGSA